MLRSYCRPILLCHPLVLLSLVLPLSPHHVAPPSRSLGAPALCWTICCVLQCRPIVLRCPPVHSLCRRLSCQLCRPIVLACRPPLPRPPYHIVLPSIPLVAHATLLCCAPLLSSHHIGWLLHVHVYPVHGLLGGGGGCGWLTVNRPLRRPRDLLIPT